jgi:hypothetical protein
VAAALLSAYIRLPAWPNFARISERALSVGERGFGIAKKPPPPL